MKHFTNSLGNDVNAAANKVMFIKRKFRLSLKARVALGVAFPIFIVLSSLSLWNYSQEYQLLDEQARLDASQLGDILIHSLNHAMLSKEGEHLLTSLSDVSQIESVRSIQVIGISGKVLADSHKMNVDEIFDVNNAECFSCHQNTAGVRPRVVALKKPDQGWRIAAPVENDPQCHECHEPSSEHLGVLLMDISLTNKHEKLLTDLQVNMAISVIGTFIVSIMSFILIHRVVVRRIESFSSYISEYAEGNFKTRIPYNASFSDELGDFASTFNRMADELERQAQLEEERRDFREKAIGEERERIARELHDGFAQMLGYLTTKVMAVRLLVKDLRIEEADHQLENLESAARNLFTDVREAIVGLKIAGNSHKGLINLVNEYVSDFSRLSGIPSDFVTQIDELPKPLSPSTELNLFRIIQESLNNVRKHSQATHARVQISMIDGHIEITITDNGVGFVYPIEKSSRSNNLGLGNILDRAHEIGAHIEILTGPNAGATILIRLDMSEME